MKKYADPIVALPVAGGLVFLVAVIWAGIVAYRPIGESMGDLAAVPFDEISGTGGSGRQVSWQGGGAESEAPAPRPAQAAWEATGRRGVFDAPAKEPKAAGLAGPTASEVQLVATRNLPFRLQLIGHFGEAEHPSGIFEAEGTPGPLIARGGAELAELGLTIRSLGTEPESNPGEGPVRMVARVWDRRTDREWVLPESVRVPSGTGAALLAPTGHPGMAIELVAGEIVEVGESEFLVERVGISPAAVTLRRLAASLPDEDGDELDLRLDEEPES